MGYGQAADVVAGALSRLLHGVRGARENTTEDLGPYLGLSPDVAFPEPPLPRNVRSRRLPFSDTITLSWKSSHEIVCPRYQDRHDEEYRVNQVAWARILRPERRRRRDCLVYVHGWLEPGSWIEESTLFPKWTRELDVDMVHVALPFHGRRNPRSALFSGEFFWTADLVRSVEAVRQAVCDVRATIAWLRDDGYEQIGVSGISLGGAITMLLGCLEPSPDFIVPIVAHLNLLDAVERAPILWRMKHDLEKWGVGPERRREVFDGLGWSDYTCLVPHERQLWIQADEDQYIFADVVEKQWQKWGRPPIHWIPGGHMTFPLHIDQMTDKIAAFRRSLPRG